MNLSWNKWEEGMKMVEERKQREKNDITII